MTSSSSCHLLDILAEVPDPRHKKGKRYPLVSILALIMTGHRGYTSVATWARKPTRTDPSIRFQI